MLCTRLYPYCAHAALQEEGPNAALGLLNGIGIVAGGGLAGYVFVLNRNKQETNCVMAVAPGLGPPPGPEPEPDSTSMHHRNYPTCSPTRGHLLHTATMLHGPLSALPRRFSLHLCSGVNMACFQFAILHLNTGALSCAQQSSSHKPECGAFICTGRRGRAQQPTHSRAQSRGGCEGTSQCGEWRGHRSAGAGILGPGATARDKAEAGDERSH
eukprot:1161454-Pelagomonas_calceolata.AAC.5